MAGAARTAGRWLLAFAQFVPLSLFAAYAFAGGPDPPPARWMQAYLLGGAAAALQLALMLPRPEPLDRLVLGANAYLLVGGAASLFGVWSVLLAYRALQETAIFGAILVVGAVTTAWTPAGFVGVRHPDRARVRRASLLLLGLTALALAATVAFPGGRRPVVTALLLALILAHRVLAWRLRATAS